MQCETISRLNFLRMQSFAIASSQALRCNLLQRRQFFRRALARQAEPDGQINSPPNAAYAGRGSRQAISAQGPATRMRESHAAGQPSRDHWRHAYAMTNVGGQRCAERPRGKGTKVHRTWAPATIAVGRLCQCLRASLEWNFHESSRCVYALFVHVRS